MNNFHLTVLGSDSFLNILNELEFNNLLNSSNQLNSIDKKIIVKILFPENLKIKEVKSYLLQNEPLILFRDTKNLNAYKDLEIIVKNEFLEVKKICTKAIAKASLSKGGISQPVSPGITVSRLPPWLVAITGFAIAIASIATLPKASGCVDEAETTISLSANAAGISSQ